MYIFNDALVYPNNLPRKLVEDIYVQGGFKILKDIIDRDSYPIGLLKIGSIVRLQDTLQFWRVKNIVVSFDADDNEVYTAEWEKYNFGADSAAPTLPTVKPPTFELKHHNFTVSIDGVPDSRPIAHTIDLQCYSFFLLNLRVSEPVKVEIFSRKDLLDRNPYTFIARHDHLVDNGDSFVEKIGEAGLKFNTSAYSIIANEDDKLGKKYYFRVTPMSSMTDTGSYRSKLITIAFEYVTIET